MAGAGYTFAGSAVREAPDTTREARRGSWANAPSEPVELHRGLPPPPCPLYCSRGPFPG